MALQRHTPRARPRRDAAQRQAMERGLVSVIIPVYNQERYLAEAIESVGAQSYPLREIIVVDDGSTDGSAAVARRYRSVVAIRQRNAGDAAARETGLRIARGEFIVFLDADDRLRPRALEWGVQELRSHPRWAFVSGQYVLVDADRAIIDRPQRPYIDRDHHLALLRGNYVGMFATVMFRAAPLRSLATLDYPMERCRDWALMLEIARHHEVGMHRKVVAEYRRHGRNVSGHPHRMLRSTLAVLDREAAHAAGDAARLEAIAEGKRYYRSYYGNQVVRRLRHLERRRRWRRVAAGLLVLARRHPQALRYHVRTKGAGLLRRLGGRLRTGLTLRSTE